MTALEPEQIDKLLEKPGTPVEIELTPPISNKCNETMYGEKKATEELDGGDDDDSEEDDEDRLKNIKMPINNGRLLDLTRMLEMKKKAQEAKKRKVDALMDKQR